jgi:hypothetical protein
MTMLYGSVYAAIKCATSWNGWAGITSAGFAGNAWRNAAIARVTSLYDQERNFLNYENNLVFLGGYSAIDY